MSSTLPNRDVGPSETDGGEFADSDPSRAGATDPLQGDERMYTGGPVETEGGPVRPQQMNVGVDNMEGGGEWPDPRTPPSPGAPGDAERRT